MVRCVGVPVVMGDDVWLSTLEGSLEQAGTPLEQRKQNQHKGPGDSEAVLDLCVVVQ